MFRPAAAVLALFLSFGLGQPIASSAEPINDERVVMIDTNTDIVLQTLNPDGTFVSTWSGTVVGDIAGSISGTQTGRFIGREAQFADTWTILTTDGATIQGSDTGTTRLKDKPAGPDNRLATYHARMTITSAGGNYSWMTACTGRENGQYYLTDPSNPFAGKVLGKLVFNCARQ